MEPRSPQGRGVVRSFVVFDTSARPSEGRREFEAKLVPLEIVEIE